MLVTQKKIIINFSINNGNPWMRSANRAKILEFLLIRIRTRNQLATKTYVDICNSGTQLKKKGSDNSRHFLGPLIKMARVSCDQTHRNGT